MDTFWFSKDKMFYAWSNKDHTPKVSHFDTIIIIKWSVNYLLRFLWMWLVQSWNIFFNKKMLIFFKSIFFCHDIKAHIDTQWTLTYASIVKIFKINAVWSRVTAAFTTNFVDPHFEVFGGEREHLRNLRKKVYPQLRLWKKNNLCCS